MYLRLSRFIGRIAVIVLLVAAVSVTGVRTAQAEALVVPEDGYGFSVGGPMTWMSDVDADRELDAAAQTGATWMRVLIDWSRVEPMPGAFNWGYVDHWIDGALRRGIKVLGLIYYTPEWARAPGTYFSAPPVDAAVYASFTAKVVQRYGDRVSDWEIWNEPNLPLFFGFVDNRPQRYTELLKAAYPTIKSLQPHSIVFAGGLSPAFQPDAPPIFVNAMYDAGAKGFFDAMAMHPYVLPTGLAADPMRGWADVEVVRQIMVDHGDGDKKIWMTELGASTSDPSAEGVSQQEQARQNHRRAVEGRAVGIQRAGVHFRDPRRRFHPAWQPRRQLRGAADLGLAAQGGGRGAGKVDRRPTAGSHIVVKVQP